VRKTYLDLVGQAGTPEQKDKAISDTEIWLSNNPKNSNVRKTYLDLVGQAGTPEQKDKAISDTEIWLSKNPYEKKIFKVWSELMFEKNDNDDDSINQQIQEFNKKFK